eukprot:415163_1
MPHVRCSKCNKSKQKNAFSKNQLRKAKQKRACKKCISNGQKQNLPRSNANNSSQVQLKKMQEEEKLDESEQSWLQKLHQHCHGKTVFTEIHLALEIKKPAEWQVGLQKIFDIFPDTFVYQNTVIIASNDQKFQTSIYLGIKNNLENAIKLIHQNTRLCCDKLLYKNGKISNKGVEFYNAKNTIDNSDISILLSEPMKAELFDEKENDAANAFKQGQKQSDNLMTLQQDQQTIIFNINKLKKQLNDKQNKMKIIMDSNVLITWNTIKAQLQKKADEIFNQENLQTFKDLLSIVLISDNNHNITIEESEGPLGDVAFQINGKTINITRNLKNQEFLNNLERVINGFAQQIKGEWNENNEEKEEHSDDVMEIFINTLKRDIMQYDTKIKCAQKCFSDCCGQISKIVQNTVTQFQAWSKGNNELWNVEMAPTKLILDISVKHEAFFIEYVIQKKQMVIEWISSCIDKYEGIYEYGVDHLWTRFISFVIHSNIVWWIAILRWLTFPVSITNLNLLRKYVQKSVDEHFMPNRLRIGTQIDVMMVVTYFMNATSNRYRANPLKFVYDKRKVTLNITDNVWESERQIIKLCNECIRFVINLLPKYKQSSNEQKMNQKIDIYMSKVATHQSRRNLYNTNPIIFDWTRFITFKRIVYKFP